jgi:hypothetical protein
MTTALDCRNIARPRPRRTRELAEAVPGQLVSNPLPLREPRTRPCYKTRPKYQSAPLWRTSVQQLTDG